MNLKNLLQKVAYRFPIASPDAAPGADELLEIQAVRTCIANVVQARESLHLVEGTRDATVQDLNGLLAARSGVQVRLAAREKEFALTSEGLPEEPFPEESEIARLSRHARVQEERVRNCESKVRESQAALDARIQEMEESWSAVGAAISDQLAESFRAAAAALRGAQLAYWSLWRNFLSKWSAVQWKNFDRSLAIADPKTFALILDPRRGDISAEWPASVQILQKSMVDLRAEIDAVKTGSPVGAVAAEAAEDDE